MEALWGWFSRCGKHGWTEKRWEEKGRVGQQSEKCAREKRNAKRRGAKGRGGEGEMQFFRSALFPATGEPPVLVSATFKFVPLSALFAEKCLFNFVYRHCKIFTRSLLLEQFSHHRERWELDDAGIRTRRTERERESGGDWVSKFTICTRPHSPMLSLLFRGSYIMRILNIDFSLWINLHIFGANDAGAQVALMFKVMFAIYRAIEISRQIVGIVQRIV